MIEKYDVMFGKPPTAYHVSVDASSDEDAKVKAIQKLEARFKSSGKSDKVPAECFIRKKQEY